MRGDAFSVVRLELESKGSGKEAASDEKGFVWCERKQRRSNETG